jgi:hypothetical protein
LINCGNYENSTKTYEKFSDKSQQFVAENIHIRYRQNKTKRSEAMTLKEVAFTLGLKEITLQKQFPRTQETLRKKGILITRWGKGKNAEYEIEYEEVEE